MSGLGVLWEEVFGKRALYYEDVGQRWSAELKLSAKETVTVAAATAAGLPDLGQSVPEALANSNEGDATADYPSSNLRSRTKVG